ncbi:hypothetical protein HIM_00036 [Hirsutella minnesotensis 3608]|nr:hypothetical protein HIM_00036 [Hirsutella minnesotensis 3608]
MPKQLAVLGRPIPRISTHRLASLLFCLSLIVLTIIALLTSIVPPSPSVVIYNTRITTPSPPADQDLVHGGGAESQTVLSPFQQPSRRPPRQKDDEYAGSSWWADWSWLSVPFSSSLTFDDERALLPPLADRQPIYCYYDAEAKKSRPEQEAESALLLTWKRAWWARGFRPSIIGPAEARRHSRYTDLQQLDMDIATRKELMRWLAWETVGGGILTYYTLLPMAADEDPMLVYLRRAKFPRLTRWRDVQDALFVGHKDDVDAAIKQVMDPAKLSLLETSLSDMPEGLVATYDAPTRLASYTQKAIRKKYAKVAEAFRKDRARGLRSLNTLVNTHLHISWQNRFPEGIEVLKPHPEHTTTMIDDGLKLAKKLASCSKSPMPSTCPPSDPHCAPCVATAPMRVLTPARYRNSSEVFSIGTVPHPWTFALLKNMQTSFNISWIRRESSRDRWLAAVTEALLGAGASGSRRVLSLKEAVASEHATSHSLWLVAEAEFPADMSWYFGFEVPEHGMDDGKSESPVPADRLIQKKKKKKPIPGNGPVASEEELVDEVPLLEQAKKVIAETESTEVTRLRTSLEAWNMADTEAWKFVRAFQARLALERLRWEEEEAKPRAAPESKTERIRWSRWWEGSGNYRRHKDASWMLAFAML